MLILALPALIVQMLRFRTEVDAANLILWVGLSLFVGAFTCGQWIPRGSLGAALT